MPSPPNLHQDKTVSQPQGCHMPVDNFHTLVLPCYQRVQHNATENTKSIWTLSSPSPCSTPWILKKTLWLYSRHFDCQVEVTMIKLKNPKPHKQSAHYWETEKGGPMYSLTHWALPKGLLLADKTLIKHNHSHSASYLNPPPNNTDNSPSS